jgi:Uncharacterised nucleotidyltransferase
MPSAALLQTLRVDLMTAELFAALHADSVDAILLKGVSIARELYDYEGERTYADCDILVSDDTRSQAESILTTLGFEPEKLRFIFGVLPGEQTTVRDPRAQHWRRARDEGEVDLHQSLFGLTVPNPEAWEALWRRTHEIVVAGQAVTVLEPDALALVITIHALQHAENLLHPPVDYLRHPSVDLERALNRWDLDVWRRARLLAEHLNGVELFAAGLYEAPGGSTMCDSLGLTVTPETRHRAVLRAWQQKHIQAQSTRLDAIAQMSGFWVKAAAFSKLLFPHPDELREADPRLTELRGIRLVPTYARRLMRLLRNLPDLMLRSR